MSAGGDGHGGYHPLATELARRRREDIIAIVQEAIRRLVNGEGNRIVPKSLPPGTLIDRGDWSSAATYRPGDLVADGGVAYVATAASTNQEPPNTTYWRPLGSTGPGDPVAYLADSDGAFIVDSDGAFLYEPEA